MTALRATCLLVLLAHAGLAVHALQQHNLTVDEGGHILSGVLAWEQGRLDVYPVNPPLVRALVALPVVISRPRLSEPVRWSVSTDWVAQHNRFMQDNSERYLEIVFRGRYALVAISLVGGWLVYRWSSQLFGQVAGLVALALWALCPNVLCWAGVCTVDLGASVFGLAAVYALRWYLGDPGWLAAMMAGWVLGLALLSKFTLLVLYPVFMVIWLVAWGQARGTLGWLQSASRWLHLVVVVAVSVLVVDIGYGFQRVGRQLDMFSFRSQTFSRLLDTSWIHGSWLEQLPVPLPEGFVDGLDEQKRHAEMGFPAYLRGQWQHGGWWYYYVYALGVKLPLGTLFLTGLAGVLMLCGRSFRCRLIDELLVWLPALAILVLVSSQTGINSHLRYVLPALPFLFIGISRVGLLLPQLWTSSKTQRPVIPFLGALTVAAALIWNAVAVARIHPHYLSYFNELAGGADNGWRHLLESNIDWGQDLVFLKRWVQKHPEAQPLRLACYAGMDPHLVGLDYELPPLAPDAQVWQRSVFAPPIGLKPGWYAVSVNLVCGASFRGYDERGQTISFAAGAYSYFQRFTPVDKAGYSIFIYHITPDEANRVRARVGPRPAEES